MIPAECVVQIQCFWSHMKADTFGYGVSFYGYRRTYNFQQPIVVTKKINNNFNFFEQFNSGYPP